MAAPASVPVRPAAGSPEAKRWAALAVLCVSLLIINLDNTVLNVALPTLVRDLHATSSDLQWIVDSYIMVFAGLLLVAGSLADRVGRKRTFLAGLTAFAAGSAWAAFSGSVGMLIAARASMGIGGALMMPSTLSIITDMFRDSGERQRAIGLWAATSGVGIALGPIVGGLLLTHFWWGSVFLINVPFAAAGIVCAIPLVPDSRNPAARRPDLTGVRVLPAAGAVALVAPFSPVLVRLAGAKLTTAGGLLIVAAGLYQISGASITSTYATSLPGMIMLGVGAGLTIPCTTALVMGSLPRGDTGVGSATNGTFMQVGGALGVAVIGSLLATRYTGRMTTVLAPHHLPHAVESAILGSVGGALGVAARVGGSTGILLAHAARSAFLSGMDLGLVTGAAVGLAGALIALAAVPGRPVAGRSGSAGTTGVPGPGDAPRLGGPGPQDSPENSDTGNSDSTNSATESSDTESSDTVSPADLSAGREHEEARR